MRNWLRRQLLGDSQGVGGSTGRSARGTKRGGRTRWNLEPLEDRRMLAVFNVNGVDFTTIQAAVTAASASADGDDEIVISSGVYNEAVNIAASANLQNLLIRSASGNAADVTVNPGAGNTAFTVADDNVTFRSLTMTGGANGISANTVNGLRAENVVAATNTGMGINGVNLSGTVMILGGSYSTNNLGIRLAGTAGSILLIDDFSGAAVNASNNTIHGLNVEGFTGGVTINGGTFNQNDPAAANGVGTGMILVDVGSVVIDGVTANANQAGIVVNNATDLQIRNSTASNNLNDGILLADMPGNVLLELVTAENNDADDDNTGDGLRAITSSAVVAIAGNLTVRGVTFRDTDGAGNVAHQVYGIFVTRMSATSDVVFGPSGGIQNNISGNEAGGVLINSSVSNAGRDVTITGGSFNENGGVGLQLRGFTRDVSITGATFNTNGDGGIALIDVGRHVLLDNVTADDNDADNDGTGAGFTAAASGAGAAIGGNLTIQNSRFRDTGGAATHQEVGILATRLAAASNLVLENVTVSGNESVGVLINSLVGSLGTNATITGGTFASNGDDGVNLSNFTGTVTADGAAFTGNADDGLQLNIVGAVNLIDVAATQNRRGVFVSTAASVTETDSTYSTNNDGGLRLVSIAGNVLLTRITADNNDANDDDMGSGIDIVGIGGNLTIRGATLRDTDGAGATNHQAYGMTLQNLAATTDLLLESSGGTAMTVTGHESGGLRIFDGGRNATFNGGSYSNNGGGTGIELTDFVGNLTLTGVDVSGNGGDGLQAVNVAGVTTISGGAYSSNVGDGLDLDGTAGTSRLAVGGNVVANSNGANGLLARQFLGDAAQAAVSINQATFNGNAQRGFDLQVDPNSFTNRVDLAALTVLNNLSGVGGVVTNSIPTTPIQLNFATFDILQRDQVNVSATQIQHTINETTTATFQPVQFNGVNVLNVSTLAGDDTIAVAATGVSMPQFVNAMLGAGQDQAEVNLIGAASLGTINLIGNEGFDSATVNGRPTDDALLLEGSTLTVIGGPVVTIATMEQFNIMAADGSDSLYLRSTTAGVSTLVDGGNGSDAFTLSSDAPTNQGTLTGIQGSLAIVGGGGSDSLVVSDAGNFNAGIGFIYATLLAGWGMGANVQYNHQGTDIEALTFNLGSGNDLVGVASASVAMTINAGAGNDFLTINPPSTFPIFFNGQDGQDWISAYFTAGSDTVLVTDTAVYSGPVSIVYNTTDVLEMHTLGGDDTVTVNHGPSLTNPPGIIRFIGGEAANDRMIINGTEQDDAISISDATGVPGRYQLTNVEYLKVYGFGGNDVIKNDSAVSSMLDGGRGNDALYGGSATDVIFGDDGLDALYGNAGDDYLYPDHAFNETVFQITGETVDGGPGVDATVALGVDSLFTMETYVGTGAVLDSVTFLRAQKLNPTTQNIANILAQGKAQPVAR
jgi:hypothetical protein